MQGRWTNVRARQGTNTPLPLERSAPGSFKRMLGRGLLKVPPTSRRPDEDVRVVFSMLAQSGGVGPPTGFESWSNKLEGNCSEGRLVIQSQG